MGKLQRRHGGDGLDFRLSMLSIALALRGDDDVDILALAREAFNQLRSLGATSGPMLAAALYHARREDLRRAVLLAGYAFSAVARPKGMCLPILLRVQQRIHDGATATHPVALVDTWSHAGECFTDERAAAIAFDGAPLDELLE